MAAVDGRAIAAVVVNGSGSHRPAPGNGVMRAEAPAHPLRILAVDDEPLVLDVIQLVLESLGHTTTALTHPMEALTALEAGLRVDLVLTDYSMPGMTGLRLAEMIRYRWPEIGIGLITSVWHLTGTTPFRVFDLVLPKPLDISRLHAELDRFVALRHRAD